MGPITKLGSSLVEEELFSHGGHNKIALFGQTYLAQVGILLSITKGPFFAWSVIHINLGPACYVSKSL